MTEYEFFLCFDDGGEKESGYSSKKIATYENVRELCELAFLNNEQNIASEMNYVPDSYKEELYKCLFEVVIRDGEFVADNVIKYFCEKYEMWYE